MFQYLIAIEPLGLLYGSAGRFLSPENLVGRSGTQFPPSAATLSGVFAAQFGNQAVQSLKVAGPFWAGTEELENESQNFYVPLPKNYLVESGSIQRVLSWQLKQSDDKSTDRVEWHDVHNRSLNAKYERYGWWLSLSDWDTPKQARSGPWEFMPHLHPRLEAEERHVARPRSSTEEDASGPNGSLFLENGVQLYPDTCLVYLSNMELPTGWYRFGGEGHMVSVTSYPLSSSIQALLNRPPGSVFALITPAVWGSNRLSSRYPTAWQDNIVTVLTDRPVPFRYRLGGKEKVKRLSRGRYAVPAGSIYVMKEPITQPWHQWDDELFPKEGPYLNRWGCGLALPLESAIGSAVSKRITTA